MKELFDTVSIRCSRLTTRTYSTSFSIGIRCLHRRLRDPIYSIYGFVRLADEIADSFHGFDKAALLNRLATDTFRSIAEKIDLNPILNAFQATVNQYRIETALIARFLKSMEMDLRPQSHDLAGLNNYIFGSAEVVGLMCLRVFTRDEPEMFDELKSHAMRLGAAFQKINFLRDLRTDLTDLERAYFPGIRADNFDEQAKKEIENGIAGDLAEGLRGIKKLPRSSRFGVYVAYVYYLALFRKLKNTSPKRVLGGRIRIGGGEKASLLACSFIRHQLNMI